MRAFDCLDIDFIKNKLYNLGIRGIFLDWINDYLSVKTMFVKINKATSAMQNIDLGIHHGSERGKTIVLAVCQPSIISC